MVGLEQRTITAAYCRVMFNRELRLQLHHLLDPMELPDLLLHVLPYKRSTFVTGLLTARHNGFRGSVLSSGTVGAAMEAAIAGRKSIAISFPFFSGWNNWTDDQVSAAVAVTGSVTGNLWNSWSPDADLYNVNVPLQASPLA